uniref:Uncharacterized protein n=1 Tax=Rhizophagus irregularis (strain DAOM 181602 / DAOM 197198 / MUCL 43194) TaxID=747089 RepID=U9UH29_RHIID
MCSQNQVMVLSLPSINEHERLTYFTSFFSCGGFRNVFQVASSKNAMISLRLLNRLPAFLFAGKFSKREFKTKQNNNYFDHVTKITIIHRKEQIIYRTHSACSIEVLRTNQIIIFV